MIQGEENNFFVILVIKGDESLTEFPAFYVFTRCVSFFLPNCINAPQNSFAKCM